MNVCVLYMSFRSKIRPITFFCVAMGRTMLFILRSILLLYSAGSGVNNVQVVLSGILTSPAFKWSIAGGRRFRHNLHSSLQPP